MMTRKGGCGGVKIGDVKSDDVKDDVSRGLSPQWRRRLNGNTQPRLSRPLSCCNIKLYPRTEGASALDRRVIMCVWCGAELGSARKDSRALPKIDRVLEDESVRSDHTVIMTTQP